MAPLAVPSLAPPLRLMLLSGLSMGLINAAADSAAVHGMKANQTILAADHDFRAFDRDFAVEVGCGPIRFPASGVYGADSGDGVRPAGPRVDPR